MPYLVWLATSETIVGLNFYIANLPSSEVNYISEADLAHAIYDWADLEELGDFV